MAFAENVILTVSELNDGKIQDPLLTTYHNTGGINDNTNLQILLELSILGTGFLKATHSC